MDQHATVPNRTAPPMAHPPDPAGPVHDTVVSALEAAARDDAPLFTLHLGRDQETLDARALLEGAGRFARALERRGVGAGERVCILLPTSAAFGHALLGCMLAGAVPVPLATPMTFGSVGRYLANLAAVVSDSGARCLVTTPRLRDAAREDPRLSDMIAHAIVPQEEDDAVASAPVPGRPSVGPGDTALIQYTSGTTGAPKGVVISHRALVANAHAIARGLALGPGDVGVSWLPVFHDMGLIGVFLTAVCHPYPVHLLRPESFVMQPRRWLDVIARTGGTISAAPNFAYDLCTRRVKEPAGLELGSWRAALNGSEPVHPSTVERFVDRFGAHGLGEDVVLPVYGLAESTLAVTFPELERKLACLLVDRATLHPGGKVRDAHGGDGLRVPSVGRPVAGASVRIVHEGQAVAERVVGEVEVAGPSLMDGYFANPEATARALRDGWLRTGDLGFLDGGRLFLVGRAKDVIIKGGRNYHPHDIERVASQVAGATGGAAAFARPNPQEGTEDLVVLVETRDPTDEGRARIAKAVRGELLAVLGVKADRVIPCGVGAIPRTTSGKVRRAECGRRVAEGGLG